MSDTTITELDANEATAFADLFHEVWPNDLNPEETVSWAYQRHPDGHPPLVAARNDDGAVVGARPGIFWQLREAGGGEIKACQVGNTCVHPDYRRRGLFTRMTEEFLERAEEEGIEVIFNVSVDAARRGYEKLGWTYIDDLRRWIWVPKPLGFALSLIRSRGALRGSAELECSPATFAEIPAFDSLEDLADLREETLREFHHVTYDKAFFEWRFGRKNGHYRSVSTDDGWCVYRVRRRRDFREVEIGELWPAEWSRRGVKRLLRVLVSREDPELVTFVLSYSHPLRRHLNLCGFLPDPRGPLNHGVRLPGDTGGEWLKPSLWALTTADLDTF